MRLPLKETKHIEEYLKQKGMLVFDRVSLGRPILKDETPPSGNNFVALSAGRGHSLALKADGTIAGWGRNDGHVVGVSVGARWSCGTIHQWYFPVRHENETHDNMDPEQVFAWLRHALSNPKQPKIGANIQYDVGWLRHEGVEVAGDLIDVQFAEAILDESAPVALESLGQKYCGEGKE